MPISYYLQIKYDEIWEENFNKLLKYNELYGTTNVPNRTKFLEYPEWERKLGRWVCTQRVKYRDGNLIEWRYNKLISTGFEFTPWETQFEQHFSDFLKFKEKYGHGLVPRICPDFPLLSSWVSHIRNRQEQITEERKKRLNEVGFIWNQIDEKWQNKFRELIEFKRIHGHFKIPFYKNKYNALHAWAVKTRRAKRNLGSWKLTDIKIQLLDSIGFDWIPHKTCWNDNFDKLLKFYNEHHHCLVPITSCNIEGLGAWVYWIRKYKHKLSEERIEQLDSIGFEWNGEIAYQKRKELNKKNKGF